LAVGADGHTLAAADPDRDVLWIVDLELQHVSERVALESGDEPGRVVSDGGDGFFVVLRGASAIAHVSDVSRVGGVPILTTRVDVCPEPRGIALSPEGAHLLVVCAGGELVEVDLLTHEAVTADVDLPGDLRDVVINGAFVYVSRFRAAEVLVLSAEDYGWITTLAPDVSGTETEPVEARVAWRMVGHDNGVALIHQLHSGWPISTDPENIPLYFFGLGNCFHRSVVSAALTWIDVVDGGDFIVTTSSRDASTGPKAVLPVDLAVRGRTVSFVSAATLPGYLGSSRRLGRTLWLEPECMEADCPIPPAPAFEAPDICESDGTSWTTYGSDDSSQAVAIALAPVEGRDYGRPVIQTRGPWTIRIDETVIPLPGDDTVDTAHDLFHRDSGAGIACASCHPDGGDDGHVWQFDTGPRRTQDLRGGLSASAPFRWDGSTPDFSQMMTELYVGHMGGPQLDAAYSEALLGWLDSLRPTPSIVVRDTESVDRGRLLFEDPVVGCADCHAGPRFTTDETVDVGTGGAFQVPSLLGVGNRLPLLHEGCGGTVQAVFEHPCDEGGDAHGRTSHLDEGEMTDLVAYVRSL